MPERPGQEGEPLAVGPQVLERVGLARARDALLLAGHLPGEPVLLDPGVEGGDRLLPEDDRPDVGEEGHPDQEDDRRDHTDHPATATARVPAPGPLGRPRPRRRPTEPGAGRI